MNAAQAAPPPFRHRSDSAMPAACGPYVITISDVTKFNGQYAEIPPNPPEDLRIWTCHAFFAPGTKADDLKKRIKQPNIDVTQVEGGYSWLALTLVDLGKA